MAAKLPRRLPCAVPLSLGFSRLRLDGSGESSPSPLTAIEGTCSLVGFSGFQSSPPRIANVDISCDCLSLLLLLRKRLFLLSRSESLTLSLTSFRRSVRNDGAFRKCCLSRGGACNSESRSSSSFAGPYRCRSLFQQTLVQSRNIFPISESQFSGISRENVIHECNSSYQPNRDFGIYPRSLFSIKLKNGKRFDANLLTEDCDWLTKLLSERHRYRALRRILSLRPSLVPLGSFPYVWSC